MITIVDYGMGNLRSVEKAFERIDQPVETTAEPSNVSQAEALVVPGVGAFDRAVENLEESGLWEPIQTHLETGKPYLGICLGLQLLFETSEEGERNGLGRYRGTVQKFNKKDVRLIPHMGWNDVKWRGEVAALAPKETNHPSYYFVHSYYPKPADSSIVAGTTEYGTEFCSAIRDGNTIAVQFHPEKSQYAGLDLLKNIKKIFVSFDKT